MGCRWDVFWFHDFVCLKWREGTEIPKWTNGFASAADEERGLIYVGGGYDRFHSREDFSLLADPVRSASVYNVEEDKWEDLPDMNTSMEPRQVGGIVPFRGVFVDGRFYVKSYPGVFEVFDSYSKAWKNVENELNQSAGIFVSAFGQIYFLTSMVMIEYDFRQEKTQVVGSLPAEDLKFAIVVNNKIFVCKWAKSEGMGGFYMLTPPSKTGEEFNLTGMQRPPGIQVVRDAATLDL